MSPVDTRMAPCAANFSPLHQRLPEKDNIKLRKPIVEKMRRDRINTCIEQLKTILEKEFHKQEPNAKLEKADILEMTVSFLRQQLQAGLPRRDYGQGYSRCWKESLHFLSVGSGSPSPAVPLQAFQQHQQATDIRRAGSSSPTLSTLRPTTPQKTNNPSSPVWRPW